MLELYLLRHAKSSWDNPELSDFDRPLADRGLRDAPKMAKRLKSIGLKVDLILSSPALRAKQTATIVAKILNAKLRFEDSIYEGSIESMQMLLSKLPKKYKRVMVVGHNPTLNDFVHKMTNTTIENIPTSGTFGMMFVAKNWNEINQCEVIATIFETPKNLLNVRS